MRKNIFDIVSESIDMPGEVQRIIEMAKNEKTLVTDSYPYYTLFDFVDEHCFRDWTYRGHCINVDDYLNAINLDDLETSAMVNTDALLTLIELVYNFWNLAYHKFSEPQKGYELHWCGNFFHLKDVMDDILDQYNQMAYMNNEQTFVLVIENKQAVTATAEILPSSLSFDVIKYNHKTLQGEVELKKNILISLGTELEPKRKELQIINKQLSEDIFFMLNNINIRHNNRSKKDISKYKEFVAKITKARLEKWYDELYQMILLVFLLLDNANRTEQIKELKSKIINSSK